MIFGRIILAIVLILTGYGVYHNYQQIHDVVTPSSVELPLGEHNKYERVVYGGYRGNEGEPYVVKLNLTIDTLPKNAWCHQSSSSKSVLGLSCLWPTPDSPTTFAAAEVTLPLPYKDVWEWQFNRESLRAVPVMRSWIGANHESIFWFLLCLIVFACCALGLFSRWEEEQPKGSILVD